MKATITQVKLNLVHNQYTLDLFINGNVKVIKISHEEAVTIIDEFGGCEIEVSQDKLMVYYISKG